MQILKTIRHCDLFPDDVPKDNENFVVRKAARSVVFDAENKVAILKVGKHGFHKLPGGGVEKGETLLEALRREIKEEIGCEIKVERELGKIIEFRDQWNIKQESICYLAKLVGEKGRPDFTEEEKENGFVAEWVSLDEAIEKIKKDQPND